MSWFRQLLCLHRDMGVIRAHRDSPFSRRNAGKLLYVDRLDVHCFIHCANCDKVFKPRPDQAKLFDDRRQSDVIR